MKKKIFYLHSGTEYSVPECFIMELSAYKSSNFLNCHRDRAVEIWIAVSCYLQCGRSGRGLNDL